MPAWKFLGSPQLEVEPNVYQRLAEGLCLLSLGFGVMHLGNRSLGSVRRFGRSTQGDETKRSKTSVTVESKKGVCNVSSRELRGGRVSMKHSKIYSAWKLVTSV